MDCNIYHTFLFETHFRKQYMYGVRVMIFYITY